MQRELALGADDGNAVQRLEFAEHVFGEAVAGCQVHMELQVAVVARAARDRQLGLDAVGRAQRDVLPGEEAQTVGARRLQVQQAHVAGQWLDAFHPRDDGLQRDVARAVRLRGLDHEIGDGGVAAQQHLTRGFLAVGQDIIVWACLFDLTRKHLGLAQTAVAARTTVVERKPRAQRGLEDGVIALDEEFVLTRQQAYVRGHDA